MAWLTLIVDTDAEHAEALSDALFELGALSVDLLDADADTPDEQAIFGEPGEPPPGVWQHNRVSALFDADKDVAAILGDAAKRIGLKDIPEHRVEELADNDWVRLTQSQFDPIPISPRLWIVPTWHTPSDPTAINIALDPGLAFGTGSHPTTRLCLRWLDENIGGGESVLDYGCGSGILAIAALKLPPLVVEEMRRRCVEMVLQLTPVVWKCTYKYALNGGEYFTGYSKQPTAPLAICHAALDIVAELYPSHMIWHFSNAHRTTFRF